MKNQHKIFILLFIFIIVLTNCFSRPDVSGAVACSPSYNINANNSNLHFKSNRIHLNINPGIELNIKKITFNASFYIVTLYIKRKSEESSILIRYLKLFSIKYKPISS